MNIPRSDKVLLLDIEMAGNIPAAGWTKIYSTSPLLNIIRPASSCDNRQFRPTRNRDLSWLYAGVDHVPGDDLSNRPACSAMISGTNSSLICNLHGKLVYTDSLGDPEERDSVHQAVVASSRAGVRSLPAVRAASLGLVRAEPLDHVLALGPSRLGGRVVNLAYVPV